MTVGISFDSILVYGHSQICASWLFIGKLTMFINRINDYFSADLGFYFRHSAAADADMLRTGSCSDDSFSMVDPTEKNVCFSRSINNSFSGTSRTQNAHPLEKSVNALNEKAYYINNLGAYAIDDSKSLPDNILLAIKHTEDLSTECENIQTDLLNIQHAINSEYSSLEDREFAVDLSLLFIVPLPKLIHSLNQTRSSLIQTLKTIEYAQNVNGRNPYILNSIKSALEKHIGSMERILHYVHDYEKGYTTLKLRSLRFCLLKIEDELEMQHRQSQSQKR